MIGDGMRVIRRIFEGLVGGAIAAVSFAAVGGIVGLPIWVIWLALHPAKDEDAIRNAMIDRRTARFNAAVWRELGTKYPRGIDADELLPRFGFTLSVQDQLSHATGPMFATTHLADVYR